MSEEITFLHFNDVYHVSDADRVARFASLLDRLDARDGGGRALRVFSGDAFSPSLEAAMLRGEHMTPVLNQLQIDVACYGNHDFDFGDERLVELSAQTQFPWTLANAVHKPGGGGGGGGGGGLLASAHEYVVRDVGGYRVGFFGLAGTDWPSNCQNLPPSDILDPAAAAQRVAGHLRRAEKCDVVVALTHMRLEEDLLVSRATERAVDLLLGGHDHHAVVRTRADTDADPDRIRQGRPNDAIVRDGEAEEVEGDVRIVKSGTDWKGVSTVTLRIAREADGTAAVRTVRVRQIVDFPTTIIYSALEPHPGVLAALSAVERRVAETSHQPLLHTAVPLEGRSAAVRSRESNLGNLLADAVRAFYLADIAFINSGSIRADRVVAPASGPLTVRDVVDICPFANPLVVVRARGALLLRALENAVSDMHADGRFLHPSGLRFRVNWKRPSGQRIIEALFVPRDSGGPEPLRLEAEYSVAVVDFIASGFDGYTCLASAPTLVSKEGAMTDTGLLLAIFQQQEHQHQHAGDRGGGAGGSAEDVVEEGVRRAREAVVRSYHDADALPVVCPEIDGRIAVIDGAHAQL